MHAIQLVRQFHRTVAERIGAMHDRFLGRARPMGEARLLWEIGAGGTEIRVLRGRLGLDSGYVSRLLHSLKRQGLIEIVPSPDDGRVRYASLTLSGLAERAELDRRSDELAQAILEPLSPNQRTALVAAMGVVERLVQASMVTFALEDAASADARWCIDQYFAELNARFEGGFNPELSISADAQELTPPSGLIVIARLRHEPIGCGAIKFHGDEPAELKRMWVSASVRGLGVGRRLLAELERRAHEAGARAVRLETNRALTEAISLYRRAGYHEVTAFNGEPYAHHWFEKRLG